MFSHFLHFKFIVADLKDRIVLVVLTPFYPHPAGQTQFRILGIVRVEPNPKSKHLVTHPAPFNSPTSAEDVEGVALPAAILRLWSLC